MEVRPGQFSPQDIAVSDLALDPRNPRLPLTEADADQAELIEFVANNYDSVTIARSIARHGYFASEPLIAVSADGKYTVVEGNRRLAALILLQDDGLRQSLELDDVDEWDEVAGSARVPATVPVVVVPDRESVAPIIGYRHISGIEPWDPWAKARFIASLVDGRGLSFERVATEVGESDNAVRAQYRNYRIIKRAEEDFGIRTDRAQNRFGVFRRAMSSRPLREHIGAPAPSDVEAQGQIVPDNRSRETAELLSWLFGDDHLEQVISESRDITKLGTAVGSPEGLAVLREERDLEEAFVAAGGLRSRLLERLGRAESSLDAALHEVNEYADDPQVIAAIGRCAELVNGLVATVETESAGAEASHGD